MSLLFVYASSIFAATAESAPDLSEDLVDQRLAALSDAGTTDETTQQSYEQAKTFLSQAAAHEREAQGYSDALTSAPEQRDVIQSRLDRLDQNYDPAAELAGLSATELNARLALARTQQSELANRLETTDRSLAAREANTASIQARLAEISQRISQLPTTVVTIDPDGSPSSVEADQWRAMAESRSLTAERRALETRLASQPARYSAMTAARAEMAINLQRLQALIGELEARVTSTDDTVSAPDDLGIDPSDPAYPVAEQITASIARLRDQQQKINEQLQAARQQNQKVDTLARIIDDRFATAQRVVEFAAGSDALGQVLLTYWVELSEYSIADPTIALPQMAGDLVIARIGHEETLASLLSASTYLNNQLQATGIDPASVSKATNDRLFDLVTAYRERLSGIISLESDYLEALTKLDSGFTDLTEKLSSYRDYLESRLLWIPNHPPLWTLTFDALKTDFAYAGARLEQITYELKPEAGFWVLAALVLLLNRRRLQAKQQVLNEKIARPRDDSIRHTLTGLLFASLCALPMPMLMLAFGIGFDPAVSAENASMFRLFLIAPALLFAFLLMQIICEPRGIGRVHFNWPDTVMDRVHRELILLTRWWLPLLIAAAVVHRLAPQSGNEALGRLLLLMVLLVLGWHLGMPQIRELRTMGRSWFGSTLNRLRALLSGVLLVALYAILIGQVFSVTLIVWVLINTFWIGVVLLLVHSLLVRWLRVARRHLRLNELLAQRSEQDDETGNIEEKVPDLVEISADTQQLITFAAVVIAAVTLYYVWAPLLPALEGLSRFTLWTSTSEVDGETIVNSITATTLLTVLALGVFTVFAAQRLPALVEIILRSRTSVSPGARYTTSTLMNYVIIGAGIVAGLSALGLQWSQLQWLIAALGVGIGFGLQEIVANFISGLIILFERPIRVGDIVTIGDKDGHVTRIRIRATTIRDLEGKELLVPNKEFITGRLLNWTLSDSQTRLEVPVGIAYGSDVDKALKVLDDVVRNHPHVLKEPSPSILFLGFGDNSLNLVARCFISRIEERMPILSDLHKSINRAFNEAGIVISFPQRDIHFDTDRPLRISMEPAPDRDG